MQHSPKRVLEKFWGYSSFRGSQEGIIASLLNGEDVLALMPTGGGKSVCFQVPALAREGICIVVSPLIALIQDQTRRLKEMGVKAIGLTGGIPWRDLDVLLDNCIHGNYKFLYLSPERLQHPLVHERLQQMPVNFIAIDEAHCISEWGHDFRPAYRNCSSIRALYPQVPTIALTATATKEVAKDIVSNLQLSKAAIYKDSFERKNITFSVIRKEDKRYALKRLLGNGATSSIVYVRSRRETMALAEVLNKARIPSDFFHGGLSHEDKKEKLDTWLKGKSRVMIATNAFGMGVDKADVGMVIHYHLPNSMENYYQEAGRAGRNGAPAQAILLMAPNEEDRAKKQFLDSRPSIPLVKEVYKKLNTYFQIAYHEGENETLDLDLLTFCTRYSLDVGKTYSTLQLLDQNGVLSLLETSKAISTIQLEPEKDALFHWMERDAQKGKVVQALLRTYGGIFEFETKIDLALLSKKVKVSVKEIARILEQLNTDGLAIFKKGKSDLRIIFLKPREDDKTINPIAGTIEKLNGTKHDKLMSMLAYAQNTKRCRAQLLVGYFGEKMGKTCGRCDICTKKSLGPSYIEELKARLIVHLRLEDKSSRRLALLLDAEEDAVLTAIKELLEEGKLKLKTANTYGIEK